MFFFFFSCMHSCSCCNADSVWEISDSANLKATVTSANDQVRLRVIKHPPTFLRHYHSPTCSLDCLHGYHISSSATESGGSVKSERLLFENNCSFFLINKTSKKPDFQSEIDVLKINPKIKRRKYSVFYLGPKQQDLI